jgi:hypothetical protein
MLVRIIVFRAVVLMTSGYYTANGVDGVYDQKRDLSVV